MSAGRVPATLFDADPPDAEGVSGTLFDSGQTERAPAPGAQRDTTGGEPRLDDVVAGLWEGLAAHRVVECPVCGGGMRPEYGAHALPIGGRCRACASTLA